MKSLIAAVLLVAFAFCQHNARDLNVNDRWMMRGAKCTNWPKSLKDSLREGRFSELKSVIVGITSDDTKAWVITFVDADGCQLGFWAESGEMDKQIYVRALSSY